MSSINTSKLLPAMGQASCMKMRRAAYRATDRAASARKQEKQALPGILEPLAKPVLPCATARTGKESPGL
ncbi:hypothetical protein POS17_1725 [Pseudomonas sp. Os17]|nr:hypothetical protein POS17_1725 [Pseudomonas sp. Os17]